MSSILPKDHQPERCDRRLFQGDSTQGCKRVRTNTIGLRQMQQSQATQAENLRWSSERSFFQLMKTAVEMRDIPQIKRLAQQPASNMVQLKTWQEIFQTVGANAKNEEAGYEVLNEMCGLHVIPLTEVYASIIEGAANAQDGDLIRRVARDPNCTLFSLQKAWEEIYLPDACQCFLEQCGSKILPLLALENPKRSELLSKFVASASDEVLYQSMKTLLMEHPTRYPAVQAVVCSTKNWIQNTHQLNTVLKILERTHRNALKDFLRTLSKEQVNLLTHYLANCRSAAQPFFTTVFRTLLEVKNAPTGFSWAQAVRRCVNRNKMGPLKVLWEATKGTHLSLTYFPITVREHVMQSLDGGADVYTDLLPALFPSVEEDRSCFFSDSPQALHYDYNPNTFWLDALEASLCDTNSQMCSLILRKNVVSQIDNATRIRGFHLLLDAQEFERAQSLMPRELLQTFSTQDLGKLLVKIRKISGLDWRQREKLLSLDRHVMTVLRHKERQEREMSGEDMF